MALTSMWFWLGALGMAVGTAFPLWRLATDRRHTTYYAVLAGVTGFAAAAYLAMALGIGKVAVGDAALFLPRYLDWLVTTPLLVLYLGMLCRPERKTYLALVGVDVLVIGSGVVAGLLSAPYSYVAYLVGCVAYVGLLYLLLRVLPRQATLHGDRVSAVFTKLRNLTVVLWTIYPVVWILGPLGLGLLHVGTEVMVVTYLDLISKVGFVFMAVNGADALDQLRTGAALADAGDGPATTAD
ncbi:bacteriorhodopsin [Halorussus gelatinilyticus]|uniref:Bacteriorhodopsin n=1 Tax=Halorussus gelatinilyticus TaxID=2937524 RepID=A0A8U0IKM4_9EURY|nr:bacteriorhodopsin [Halorussus gelatinilyticus]UPW00872.1 bacteriorhodopsin [Halorussus gelatinilyticus]